jgi:hypothetical protein
MVYKDTPGFQVSSLRERELTYTKRRARSDSAWHRRAPELRGGANIRRRDTTA